MKKSDLGKISRKYSLPFFGGLLFLLFSIFTVISVLSYLFTWKRDQSLLSASDLLEDGLRIANGGGAIGYGWGHFLVGKCFGLAALLLCAALVYAALCVFFPSCKVRMKKMPAEGEAVKFALASIFGTLSLSLLLSYVSEMYGGALSSVWEGGLGGGVGSFLVLALCKLFGNVIAVLFVVVLAVYAVYLFNIISFRQSEDVSAQPVGNEDAEAGDEVDETEADDAEGSGWHGAVADEAPTDSGETAAMTETAVGEDVVGGGFVDGGIAVGGGFVVEDVASQGTAPQLEIPSDTRVEITGPEEEITTEVTEDLPPLDIKGEVDRYENPSLDLLLDYADKRYTIPQDEIDRNVNRIKSTLASFKIPIEKISASVGYTVTLYKIVLGEGIRVNSVKNLEDDIAIKIGIKGVRVVMLADAVGIEVPNEKPSVVPLKAILNSDAFRNSRGELPIALGYTITTKAKVFDLADAPHLLVAGATKQGKSVGLNAIISSLLYAKHPTELKLVFIDPKMVEFQKYSKLYKHYLAILPQPRSDADEAENAIVKDARNAEAVLRSLCVEMDERYKLLSVAGVNKITDYNVKFRNRRLLPTEGHHFLPYLVVVIDEYADLTKASFGTDKNISRSIENSINRLAAKGRAAGLHVIIATQRPSVDVITGTIKGNFPTRMAFRTSQRQDSQTILGMAGAEKLIGKGDMLFFTGADAERVQCALVDSDEIDSITRFIASQTGYKQCCTTPYYLPDPGDAEGGDASSSGGGLVDMTKLDELFEESAKLAVINQGLSTSMLQRKLQLGFARAGRIMDQLEAAGVVGPQQGAKPREALVPDLASLEELLSHYIK